MADFNSELPVRTQNNGDVVVKVVDGTTTTQTLSIDSAGRPTVKLDDGNGNIVTSQVSGSQRALDVGIDVAGVQIDPRQVRALTAADIITAQQGTSPWISKDQSDGPVAPGTAASFSMLGGAVYNTTPPAPTAGQQVALQLDSAANLKTAISQPLPAGTNIIGAVNLDLGSNPISATNPLPVTISTTTPGLAVQAALTSASLAVGASATLTYTVATGHTFNLQQVIVAASGKIKAVVQNGATTMFVVFNSTATPTVSIPVLTAPLIAAAGTINVVITNLDIAAQDVYATVEGNQN